VEEFGQILRRGGQVGVLNHQHIAGGGCETLAYGVAFAAALSLVDELDVFVGVEADLIFNFRRGAVGAIAVHEYDFSEPAHLRDAGDGIGDIAAFIAAGYDD